MRKIVTIAFGIIVMLVALWVGAYVLGQMPYGHWARTPTLITSVLLGAAGYGAIVYGAIHVKGWP